MLIRFDPFREFDRLTQEMWGSTPATPARIAMDAVRKGDKVEISFELPGVDPDSIDVEVENNVLTVSAERRVETERKEGEEVLVRERRYGRFTRQLSLGDNLDASRIEARYEDGVLHVTVPVAEQAKPRKVEVSRGESSPAIEAEASES
ncbi:MAG: Hsp20/alpha crystallin family protein [Acidimicrobiales bacterium]